MKNKKEMGVPPCYRDLESEDMPKASTGTSEKALTWNIDHFPIYSLPTIFFIHSDI